MPISFNERTLILENYGSPLRVITLDEGSFSRDTGRVLSKAFNIPEKKIMSFSQWKNIRDIIIRRLSAGEIDSQYTSILIEDGVKPDKKMIKEFIDSRDQFIEWSKEFENIDYFCNKFAMISMFLSSEGSITNTYSDVPVTPFGKGLSNFIFTSLVSENEAQLSSEDYAYWLRISKFMLEPVSNRFKDDFKKLYEYEIPYGLSPKTDKTTLESILSQAKNASIIPIVQGSIEIGNAISANEWLLAIEAAATSGATVLILVGSVKAAEIVYKWQRNK